MNRITLPLTDFDIKQARLIETLNEKSLHELTTLELIELKVAAALLAELILVAVEMELDK